MRLLPTLILLSAATAASAGAAPPASVAAPPASVGADWKPQMAPDRTYSGPLGFLRNPSLRRQRQASVAGALGLAVGWAVTPTIVDPNPGRVATPEAWRRRIKAKYKVPLVQRAPRILAIGLACFTMAEFALALQEGSASPRSALLQTTVDVVIANAAARAAPKLEPLTSFVDARVRPRLTRFLPS